MTNAILFCAMMAMVIACFGLFAKSELKELFILASLSWIAISFAIIGVWLLTGGSYA